MSGRVGAPVDNEGCAPSRARWAAIGAAVAVVLGAGGLMTATAVGNDDAARSVFVPITPCRVMDTRPAPQNVGPRSTPLGAAETHTISIVGTNGNCTIPAGATGVSLNVTGVNPTADSFLTVFPADAPQPVASNLNFVGGQDPVPNAVTVDLSADGKISFFNNGGTVDVVADIVGFYESSAHDHDDRYYTESEIDASHYSKAEIDARDAAQKSISIDVLALESDAPVTGTGSFAGRAFGDATDAMMIINFTAPPDLTPGTAATVRVNYFIRQTGCTVSLAPRGVWVAREGEVSPTIPSLTAPLPGFVAVGGDPRPAVTPAGANAVAEYTISQPLDGEGLAPGDAVSLVLHRKGTADTCTFTMFVTGIEVLYS